MLRLILILFLAFAPTSGVADTTEVRDRIVNVLRKDGYNEIRLHRTFLGRMRFVATDDDRRREIVVNPRTGVILRDYVRFLVRKDGDSSGGGGRSYDNDDDEDDDDYDDEEDDDDGEGGDNSGSGSGDDEDDEDNSGSGSSNSGSGSSGSGSGSDDDD